MKKTLFYSLLLISIFSCKVEKEQETVSEKDTIEALKDTIETIEIKVEETLPTKIETVDLNEHQTNYQRLKAQIKAKQRQIKNRADIDQAEKVKLAQTYTSNILIDSMFQYWLGTEWDFNGYTAKPRNGLIACGYFVSTTLKHTGFELDRYKVAQKAAADIIKSVCDTNSIQRFSSLASFETYLENIPNREILILGLDNHVGFVFRDNNQNYFAHSNYINRAGVMVEPFDISEALRNSYYYYIGSLSSNQGFFERWLE